MDSSNFTNSEACRVSGSVWSGRGASSGSAGSISSLPFMTSQRKKIFKCTVVIRSEAALRPSDFRWLRNAASSSVPRSGREVLRDFIQPASASSVWRTDS